MTAQASSWLASTVPVETAADSGSGLAVILADDTSGDIELRATMSLEIHPVTPERLDDLRCFSETHGKFRYCSCMRWRLTSTVFQQSSKEDRTAPVWSVVCFFLDRRVRGQGLRGKVLEAAVSYAHEQEATTLEGYPVEPGCASYGYMGLPSLYEAAGFHEVMQTRIPGAAPRHILRHPNPQGER